MRYWTIVLFTVAFTLILSNSYAQEAIPSPLKQIHSGIQPQDVKCNVGLSLLIKSSNANPYCVSSSHIARLLLLGWVTSDKFGAIHPAIKYNENKTQNILMKNTNNDTTHQQISFTESNSTIPITNTTSESGINLPAGISTPIVSATKPGIKILSIGMSPNPLKVGDTPKFTLTYQNISDKPIYENIGCTQTPLSLAIFPSDSIVVSFPPNQAKCPDQHAPLSMNQTDTARAWPGRTYGFYQIMKPGTLNVTLQLYLQKDAPDSWDLIETIKFNVNATKLQVS